MRSVETRVCSSPDCPRDGEPQPLTAFYPRRDGAGGGWRGYCKSCMLIRRYRRERRAEPDPDRIECLECGLWFASLARHLRLHGLNAQSYRAKYPGAPVVSETFAAISRDQLLDRFGVLTREGDVVSSRWASRSALINALRRDAKRRGRPPSQTEWKRSTKDHPTAYTVWRYFGTWNAALVAAGLEVRGAGGARPVIFDEERIIAALRREYERTGRVPALADWKRKRRRPSATTIQNKFGTWNAALAAAGLETRMASSSPVIWTRERIVFALRGEYERTGRVPSHKEWNRPVRGKRAHPSAATVVVRFGSWNAAVEAAGLPVRKPGQRGGGASPAAVRGRARETNP